MHILGLSCFYHDAGACLLRDGELIAAAEEERFSRRKHDASLPVQAAAYCLEAANIDIEDVDHVIFYEKPLLKFERLLASCVATFPHSRQLFVQAMQTWLTAKLWTRGQIRSQLGYRGRVLYSEHHLSHAASAFYPSPFAEAAVITADGVGEWATTTLGLGHGIDLTLTHEIDFPHSLGLLYSAFTAYLGFEVNEGEYKVMGMAAYGKPRYVDQVRQILRIGHDGSFRLTMRYLGYHATLRSYNEAFVSLFGPVRASDASVDERFADVAASIQLVTEEAMLALARHLRGLSGLPRLCLAGGVALNVLANARILREAGFDELWIQPAAGDSGGCIGAASYLYHAVLRQPRVAPLQHAYLGPAFSDEQIQSLLREQGIAHEVVAPDQVASRVADLLAAGQVVGWFQGRMEFGPRALGNRSILADPTRPTMRDVVNEKIKHRELFRPFAPSVVAEAARTYFDFDGRTANRESPYMLLVARVRPDKQGQLPAITHVDGTARVQTVRRDQNPLYYDLLQAFGKHTGVPVLLNTSFNVRGEPIVCTPAQAFNSFSHTEMDTLVLGRALIPASAKRQLGPYPGGLWVNEAQEVVV